MSEATNSVQLIVTGERVPLKAAELQAGIVYTDFAKNTDWVEDFYWLTWAVRRGFDSGTQRDLLVTGRIDHLLGRNYFSKPLTEKVLSLTLRSKIAANMIVPELDDGAVYGHVQEPFVNHLIVERLYTALQRNELNGS